MATTIGTIELIAKIDTAQYKKGASEIDKTNKDIEGSSSNAAKKTGSAFTNASKVATAAIIAAGAAIVGTFVNSASDIQSLRASFESLTGNVTDTNSVMTELYDLGKKTAFDNKDIQSAGRNYLAAGVSVKDLGKVLKDTADIAGATGADLGQLTLPLTQTIARGKLQTQDFYQILNSGAGALRKPLTELAGQKGFGSLADALEAGAISSGDLLKVMDQVTQKGGFAFQGAIKQSETFKGRMSNLKEAITNVGLGILGVDAITGKVDPAGPFAKLSSAVSQATSFLTNNGQTVKQVGTVIAIFLMPAIISLGIQGLLAGARLAAGMLLALGPIGLIIAIVAAAAFLIISNWSTVKVWLSAFWGWLGSTASSAWEAVKNVFSSVGSFFAGVWGSVVNTFTSIGSTIGNAVGNAFKSAINGVLWFLEREVNGIVNIINAALGAIDRITPGSLPRLSRVSLPRLADGGIVPPRPGGVIANIAEAGEAEAVIPLSKLDQMIRGNTRNVANSNGSYNITINLSGTFATSKAEQRKVAQVIVDRFQEIQRSKALGGGMA